MLNAEYPKLIKVMITTILLLIFGIVVFVINRDDGIGEVSFDSFFEFETARVVEILEDNTFMTEEHPDLIQGDLILEVELMTGQHRGMRIVTQHYFMYLHNVAPEIGDSISVRVSTIDGELAFATFESFERRGVLIGSIVLFFAFLVAIGGKKGLMSIVGLCITLVSIVFLLVPLMLRGFPIILTTIGILIFVVALTLVLLFGFEKKSYISMIGCLIGTVFAALISWVIGDLIHLNGLNTEHINELMVVSDNLGHDIQPHGLFISGILISSVGAVMDIAISIVAAMEEMKLTSPKITSNELFKSGMNVGRDMMGTMSNTLIFAFVGTALNMIIIIYARQNPFNQLINFDFVALEIVRGVAGSMGIVISVPIVALITAKWPASQCGLPSIKQRNNRK